MLGGFRLWYNSAGDYYEISAAQDLVDLANYVNSSEAITAALATASCYVCKRQRFRG